MVGWFYVLVAIVGFASSFVDYFTGKLVTKTASSEGILLDMAAGFLGSLPLASMLGNNSTFDSVLAGGLGAMLALAVLNVVRARLRPD